MSASAALAASEEAIRRCGGRALHLRHRQLVAADPERPPGELRLALLAAAARAGADTVRAAAASAARLGAADYPHVLYVYGAWLRAAGLWEQLVLLLDLSLAMNFPASPAPPAAPDAAAIERQLSDYEDKVSPHNIL